MGPPHADVLAIFTPFFVGKELLVGSVVEAAV